MVLRAFWYGSPAEATIAQLMERLGGAVSIAASQVSPDDPDYDVLIAVSPPPGFIGACEDLRTVIIPQAGLTASMRSALSGHNLISAHNCHHNAAAWLLLACAKFTNRADSDLRNGDWALRYSERPQIVLKHKSALILGYGSIGRAIAPICSAMGMRVTAVRRSLGHTDPSTADPLAADPLAADPDVTVHAVEDLDELLPNADVLICALPSTPDTRQLVGTRQIGLLPRDAIVVNIGRAEQIDERALYDALKSRHLAGAGLDVWSIEPGLTPPETPMLPSSLAFHELDNVVLSPHKAGWLPEDDPALVDALASLLRAVAAGEDVPNLVDVDRGY